MDKSQKLYKNQLSSYLGSLERSLSFADEALEFQKREMDFLKDKIRMGEKGRALLLKQIAFAKKDIARIV